MTKMTRWVVALLTVIGVSGCGSAEEGDGGAAASTTGTTAASASPKSDGCGLDRSGAPAGPPPVLGIHHVSSLTRERYEAVVRELTGGHERLQSTSDGNIDGLMMHAAGEGDDGFWIIDVWATQDAANRFAQRVRPIAQSVGIAEPMKIYRLHTFLTC